MKIKSLITSVIFLILFFSCKEENKTLKNENITSVQNNSIKNISPEKRIADIKIWYETIQNEMKTISSTECITGSEKVDEKMDENFSQEFENKARECKLSNNFKVITSEFNGHEWQEKFNYYYKNQELFFVYYEIHSESCSDEYRIYYDEKNNPIQILTKTNDCTGNYVSENIVLNDKKKKSEILETIKQISQKTQKILNNEKN